MKFQKPLKLIPARNEARCFTELGDFRSVIGSQNGFNDSLIVCRLRNFSYAQDQETGDATTTNDGYFVPVFRSFRWQTRRRDLLQHQAHKFGFHWMGLNDFEQSTQSRKTFKRREPIG